MQWIRYGGIVLLILIALGGLGAYRWSTIPDIDNLEALNTENIDGPPDAPVQIVEFGDFGCPSCRAWHRAGIKSQLKQQYGDQISFTFRHFPVITPQSSQAAEAAQCAAEQDAFWEYHDYLYEQANGLSVEQLEGYAEILGLDTGAFSQCLDSGKYRDYVQRDMRSARTAGARGTPTFLVNGQLVAFPSYQGLASMIEAELQ